MLTQLRLQNFKTWQDTTPLRLAPITVFFGGNSSGKSSIGQFLLMLRRTVEQPDRNLVLHTSDDRGPVDLGSYSAYVHSQEDERNIEFDLQWNVPGDLALTDPLKEGNAPIAVSTLGFRGCVGTMSERREAVVAKALEYRLNPVNGSEQVSIRLQREASAKYKLTCAGFEEVRKVQRVWPLPKPSRFYGFPDELYAYYQNVAGFADFQLELERMCKHIHYLGPLREYPRRQYPWNGQTPTEVGFSGENTIGALLAGEERKLSPGGRARYVTLPAYVSQWLKALGVVEDFRVQSVSKHARIYEVLLKMPGRKREVALPDVGFGVSQVLPVVTAAFYAPQDSTVIIEQPELHLHPAVQSELADMFIAAIRSKEWGKEMGIERNVQFLIESHSEHFLRRLQRRLAEEKLLPKEIAVYFCEAPQGSARSTIHPLEINEYGRIRNWPKNFFGDQMTDIAQMTLAGIEREARAMEVAGR